jgi:glycosyltransferase involved in cell wall biosynthesis
MNIVSRFLVNVLLRQSDSNFFETKHLVNTYKNLNRKTYWFPNYRQDSKSRISSSYNHRFIYLGRVCKEKGILDLAEALSLTSTKITVDVYGPIEDISEEIFNERLLYKGVIGRDEIYETLSNYSALVLPSYREGYAGVVVEAMCVGIPLVLSNLPTLREMVEPPAAVFFEPGSSNDLAHCLQVIEKDYTKMRWASRDSFSKFEKFRVLSKFFIDSEIALN